jgi:retron-type reverse transcriptase
MKRASSLFEKIVDRQNLREAYLKTVKGKRRSAAVMLFRANLDGNLQKIAARLSTPNVRWGGYTHFRIKDPKERVISAAPIEDRVAHHAIMNVLEEPFERQMIFHNYACRKGKGTHAAIQYAFCKCRSNQWFLKLDVRRYFDSIDHGVLRERLSKIIKDKKTLALLDSIIDSYHTKEGKGVPIGNLTSQFFANLYLSPLDHYILENLKPAAYERYMDDFVLFSNSKERLKESLIRINSYAAGELKLELKPPVLGSTADGLPFLGFAVKRHGIYLLAKSKRRMKKRMAAVNALLARGVIDEETAAERLTSVFAAVLPARTLRFRRKLCRETM